MTPKATQPAAGSVGPSGVSREPVRVGGGRWAAMVPYLMFGLLGLGVAVILVNYLGVLWEASNWYLLGGLGLILAGIVAATQYR